MSTLLPPTNAELLRSQYGASARAVLAVSLIEKPPEQKHTPPANSVTLEGIGATESYGVLVQWWNAAAAQLLGCAPYQELAAPETAQDATRKLLAALEPDLTLGLALQLARFQGGASIAAQTIPSNRFDLRVLPCHFVESWRPPTSGRKNPAVAATTTAPPKQRRNWLSCFRAQTAPEHQADAHEARQPDERKPQPLERGHVRATLLVQIAPLADQNRHQQPPPLFAGLAAVMPTPSGGVSSGTAGRALASLIASHARPNGDSGLAASLFSGVGGMDALCLACLPLCVTVFSLGGRVCLQNAASREYYGSRTDQAWPGWFGAGAGGQSGLAAWGQSALTPGCREPESGANNLGPEPPEPLRRFTFGQNGACEDAAADTDVLGQLFSLDSGKLKAMLSATAVAGGVWEGIVRAPSTLHPDGASRLASACGTGGSNDDGVVAVGGVVEQADLAQLPVYATHAHVGQSEEASAAAPLSLSGSQRATETRGSDRATSLLVLPLQEQQQQQSNVSSGGMPLLAGPSSMVLAGQGSAGLQPRTSGVTSQGSLQQPRTLVRLTLGAAAALSSSLWAAPAPIPGDAASGRSAAGSAALRLLRSARREDPSCTAKTEDGPRPSWSDASKISPGGSMDLVDTAGACPGSTLAPAGGGGGPARGLVANLAQGVRGGSGGAADVGCSSPATSHHGAAPPVRAGVRSAGVVSGARPLRRSRLLGPVSEAYRATSDALLPDQSGGGGGGASTSKDQGSVTLASLGDPGSNPAVGNGLDAELSSQVSNLGLQGLFHSFTCARGVQARPAREGGMRRQASGGAEAFPAPASALARTLTAGSPGSQMSVLGRAPRRHGSAAGSLPAASRVSRSVQKRYMSVDPLATSTWQVLCDSDNYSSFPSTDVAEAAHCAFPSQGLLCTGDGDDQLQQPADIAPTAAAAFTAAPDTLGPGLGGAAGVKSVQPQGADHPPGTSLLKPWVPVEGAGDRADGTSAEGDGGCSGAAGTSNGRGGSSDPAGRSWRGTEDEESATDMLQPLGLVTATRRRASVLVLSSSLSMGSGGGGAGPMGPGCVPGTGAFVSSAPISLAVAAAAADVGPAAAASPPGQQQHGGLRHGSRPEAARHLLACPALPVSTSRQDPPQQQASRKPPHPHLHLHQHYQRQQALSHDNAMSLGHSFSTVRSRSSCLSVPAVRPPSLVAGGSGSPTPVQSSPRVLQFANSLRGAPKSRSGAGGCPGPGLSSTVVIACHTHVGAAAAFDRLSASVVAAAAVAAGSGVATGPRVARHSATAFGLSRPVERDTASSYGPSQEHGPACVVLPAQQLTGGMGASAAAVAEYGKSGGGASGAAVAAASGNLPYSACGGGDNAVVGGHAGLHDGAARELGGVTGISARVVRAGPCDPSTVSGCDGGGDPAETAAPDPVVDAGAASAGGVSSSGVGMALAWHEVRATCMVNPQDGRRYLLVVQKDVTAKVEAERHIAQVSECEHRLLEQIFPRHVLAYMTDDFMTNGSQHDPHQVKHAQHTQHRQELSMEEEDGTPVQGRTTSSSAAAAGYGTTASCLTSSEDGAGGDCKLPAARTDSWRPYVRDCTQLATWHAQVTILFADVQGFTPMCKQLPPAVVMKFLNDLFVRFDAQLDQYGVYKVETIGDCYVVAGGLIREDADGMATVQGSGEVDPLQAEKVFAFAQAMLRSASRVVNPITGQPVRIRVGVHSGPVVSGVVGTRMPRFCLFGDTINTASRMESTGSAGSVHVSRDTFQLLPPRCREGWTSTGGIEVKGKGLMETHLWTPGGPQQSAAAAASTAGATAFDGPAQLAHSGPTPRQLASPAEPHGQSVTCPRHPQPRPESAAAVTNPTTPSAVLAQRPASVQQPAGSVVRAAAAPAATSGAPRSTAPLSTGRSARR